MEDLRLSKMSSEIKSYVNEGCNVGDEENFMGAKNLHTRNDGAKENDKFKFGGDTDFGKIVDIYR